MSSQPSTGAPDPDALIGPDAELVVRYLKHRWPKAVEPLDALPDELPWTELDLDPDVIELDRAIGRAKLERVAAALLAAGALPDDAPALRALEPEQAGARGRAFLRVAGCNLALRLRTDALLGALLACAAQGAAPRPAPALAGAIVGRCRSRARADALVRASPLGADASALGALRTHALPPGARLFADAAPEALAQALTLALRPRKPVEFGRAPPDAKRFLVLRRRGAFSPVLGDGDDLPLDVARAVARQPGVRRVAWVRAAAGAPPQVAVFEGQRLVLETSTLGSTPTDDDVCGELLAIGVTDLDPDHPRGATPMVFAAHVGGGPPLGVERRLRRANVHALAFA